MSAGLLFLGFAVILLLVLMIVLSAVKIVPGTSAAWCSGWAG